MNERPETLTAAADLLRAGHDLMMEKGRCPDGGRDDSGGRVCMLNSLAMAAGGYAIFERHHGWTDAIEALDAVCGMWVPLFNDAPTTTDDDCFDAYARAEKALREQAAR